MAVVVGGRGGGGGTGPWMHGCSVRRARTPPTAWRLLAAARCHAPRPHRWSWCCTPPARPASHAASHSRAKGWPSTPSATRPAATWQQQRCRQVGWGVCGVLVALHAQGGAHMVCQLLPQSSRATHMLPPPRHTHTCAHTHTHTQARLPRPSWAMSGWPPSTATPRQQRRRRCMTCARRAWARWCWTSATTGAACSRQVCVCVSVSVYGW
jgi:hypothetical protein